MQPTLYLYRGLPGSGKSTLARKRGLPLFEADDYFMTSDKEYRFNGDDITKAHAHCQNNVRRTLHNGQSCCVANTFTKQWEIDVYRKMAVDEDAELRIIDLYDGGLTDEDLVSRNVHDIPEQVIRAMRSRWEF